MSSNVPNQMPFLRSQRLFPQEPQPLSVEIDRMYTDVANSVNFRSIGIFATNNPAQNGETWYLNGNRYQGFRRVYPFTAAGNISHGINMGSVFAFTRIYGTLTNNTNWYPLPYVDATAANNQVQVVVTPTQIQITAGGGAPPTITRGFVVLEWISQA